MKDKLITLDYKEYLELERLRDDVEALTRSVRIESINNPLTITNSIRVIMSSPNLLRLLKIGGLPKRELYIDVDLADKL